MSWATIRGHDAARNQLLTAYKSGRFAHAYLFVGSAGVGKHLFAVELAKALLCESPRGPLEFCGRCPGCIQVAAGTHPDFFTVKREEGKNELTIDPMREFCHRIGLKPARGSRKIGVVEEADYFNDTSANVFLKPLEEPPAGSLLILLGTSTDRQLATILSRCQVVPFRPLGVPDMRTVLADHNITDTERVSRLLRLSGGSPGRALALNDDVFWTFRNTLFGAITAVKPDPISLADEWVRFAESAGKQTSAHRERALLALGLLIDILQEALRCSVGRPQSLTDGSEAAALRDYAARTGTDRIIAGLEACLDAETQIERYLQIGLVIEALLDRLCRRSAA